MSGGLIVRNADVPDVADDVQLQQLWLSISQHSWQSLAVLGVDKNISTIDVANLLAHLAWCYTGQPSCVLDMRDLSLRLLELQIREMGAQLQGGERVFVALRSLSENPTVLPLAMAADAVVLCIETGKTESRTVRQTVDAIGRQRFLGTILVNP